MELQLANRSILQCLELAAANNEYINVEVPRHRKIGKSKALIEFARENNYTVLANSKKVAEILINRFCYKNVRTVNFRKTENLDELGPCVFEEGISPAEIKELKIRGVEIVTGYLLDRPFDRPSYEIDKPGMVEDKKNMNLLISMGVLSINEVREHYGLKPIPLGHELYRRQ
ncbi:hypothetical protein ABFV99_14705 [Cytobacillus horneckiae]|uniref:hypothetical protein n=1 Tax=Cytobacillus horneckiae TaxID=549687 RepID=UPI0034CDE728